MSNEESAISRRRALKQVGLVTATGALGVSATTTATAATEIDPTVSDISGTDVTVTWNDVGAERYYLYWRNSNSGNSASLWRQGTQETIDLYEGTTYYIWVGADLGSSFEWSQSTSVFVPRAEDGGDSGDTVDPSDFAAAVEEGIHEGVNERRQANGYDTLSYSDDIATVARDHSQYQADRGGLSHVQADGDKVDDRLAQDGISCLKWGENVLANSAADLSASEAANKCVDLWMKSPGHRENILDAEFTVEGVGVVTTGQGRLYATQVLGTNCG